jgi:hypothetical protein
MTVFLRVYLFTMALSTGPASQKASRELCDETADGSASNTIPWLALFCRSFFALPFDGMF